MRFPDFRGFCSLSRLRVPEVDFNDIPAIETFNIVYEIRPFDPASLEVKVARARLNFFVRLVPLTERE